MLRATKVSDGHRRHRGQGPADLAAARDTPGVASVDIHEHTDLLTRVDGVIAALAVTGGVITSAGILLAAVFAVLGVLPLITLTELGAIVGFGVLLDSLIVRTVLVPAVVMVARRAVGVADRTVAPSRS